MGSFKNLTLGVVPLSPSTIDMEKIHDAVAAGGSGRLFYGGGYPPYYNNGYYGGGISSASAREVMVGIVILVFVFFIVFWILAFLARMNQRYYYGIRKKRSAFADTSDLDILLTGGASTVDSWRSGRQNLLKTLESNTGESELDMSARIVDSIEKGSLDFD